MTVHNQGIACNNPFFVTLLPEGNIRRYLYDRYFIYKTVKSSHLKKLQIIKNINNNLIFQVIVPGGVMIEPENLDIVLPAV